MAELAAEEVPGLIAEARIEARQRARELLVEVLTEAMLEQAQSRGREVVAPARRQRGLTPDGVDVSAETGLYVYCVVGAAAEVPSGLSGVDPAHGLELVIHDAVAAVVSRVPLEDFEEERLRERLADMGWVERTARRHEAVLDSIGARTTLIPMRLCTVYRSESGVIEMLAREAKALEEALIHLQGKQEWGVKVFAVGEPPVPRSEEEPEDASGTDYMRRRQDEREQRRVADQRLHDICVSIHERLAGAASDAVSSPPQRPEVSGHEGEMLLNGVYLVQDEERETFLELVSLLEEEHRADGLEFVPTGPWPAYNFVPGTIGAAW